MKTFTKRSLSLSLLVASLALSGTAFAQLAAPSKSDVSAAGASAEDFAFARRLSRVFRSVANKVEPAVVHVTQQRMMYQTDFFGRRVGRGRMMQSGLGSGAIIDSSGIVVTNNHVVEGGETLQVKLSSGDEYPAKLLGKDPQTDLAVLQIENAPNNLPSLSFADSNEIEVGEWVVAVGSPFGLDNTVTQGIVSARGRTVTPRETGRSYEDYIQTDAAINPGNSGGPLVNLSGEIVGINSAIASRTGGYDGIGFAIPANTARLAVDSIRKNGRVIRGWLGVGFSPDNADGAQPRVRVDTIMKGSPADAAGLKEGDVITKFQGVAMDEPRLRNAIASLPAGSNVSIEVLRDAAPVKLTAMLGDREAATNSTLAQEIGAFVTPLDERAAKSLGFDGVRVVEFQGESIAQEYGVQPNDIIVAVNDDDVTDITSLHKALSRADFRRGVRLNLVRGEDRGYIILRSR